MDYQLQFVLKFFAISICEVLTVERIKCQGKGEGKMETLIEPTVVKLCSRY
jgi:hypothetical protein